VYDVVRMSVGTVFQGSYSVCVDVGCVAERRFDKPVGQPGISSANYG
jgi:hypothetical protein